VRHVVPVWTSYRFFGPNSWSRRARRIGFDYCGSTLGNA
jgi:hypothetical protein